MPTLEREALEQYWRRKSMRGATLSVTPPVRVGAPLEELAAYLESEQSGRDYLAAYREFGFMHPLTEAAGEYRQIAQALHGRIEYTNTYGCSCHYDDEPNDHEHNI